MLQLPGGYVVLVSGKTAVKVFSVCNFEDIEAGQIVMWPDDALAIRQTAQAIMERLLTSQNDI